MNYIQIIIMAEVLIAIITAIFIMKIHYKGNENIKLSGSEDFFTSFYKKKEDDLIKADSPINVSTYIKILICAPIILCVISFFFSKNILFSVLLMIFGFFIPDLVIKFMQARAASQFEEMYAKALEQLASSLRAGRNITDAVSDVVNCKFIHPSMKKRFAKISADLDMGISIEKAFTRFADNTTNQDAKDVALAIAVQNKTGGHEAEVVQSFAEDIRTRIMMRKKVKTIFATTNITVRFMNFLCPVIILFACLFMPDLTSAYFESADMFMIFIIIISIPFIGMLVSKKMLSQYKQK